MNMEWRGIGCWEQNSGSGSGRRRQSVSTQMYPYSFAILEFELSRQSPGLVAPVELA